MAHPVITRFRNVRVLIVGDIMIDHYFSGDVKRISPEAPVPVVEVKNEYETLGGAANVAANISALGGQALCVYIAGEDEGKERLRRLLNEKNIKGVAIVDPTRRTTIKSRVVSRNQQLLRLDHEDRHPISENAEKAIAMKVEELLNKKQADVLILSDYAKGTLTPNLIASIFAICKKHQIKSIIDPKPQTIPHCKGSYLITPNHYEASAHSGINEEDEASITRIGKSISEELNSNVLITRGSQGMALFEQGQTPLLIPTQARSVYDVSGAGDTVTATIALCIGAGASLASAVSIANAAAGIVVGKPGTATLNAEELLEKL